MDFAAPASEDLPEPDAIIVKADEVDEAGADISTISPTSTSSETDFTTRIENRRAADAQPTGSPKILANALPSPPRPLPRPILRREGSVPQPPKQPPPPAPSKQDDGPEKPTDSLSLQQLKKLVGELPKLEPTAYAYAYEETRSLEEEIGEWFAYTDEERAGLLGSREIFEERWHDWITEGVDDDDGDESSPGWKDAEQEDRDAFVDRLSQDLRSESTQERVRGSGCLSYIALGIWGDNDTVVANGGGHHAPLDDESQEDQVQQKPSSQLKWMFSGTKLLSKKTVVQGLVDCLEQLWKSELSVSHGFLQWSLLWNLSC